MKGLKGTDQTFASDHIHSKQALFHYKDTSESGADLNWQ